MAILRDKLIARLEKLGVQHRRLPGCDDGFASLCHGGKPFAHFHSDHELDIRLSKAIIEREGLQHPPGSIVHPNRSRNSPWIEIRFTKPADVDRLIDLVKLAIDQM